MTPISKVPKALLKAKDTPEFLDSVFVDLSSINEGKPSYFILEESSESVDCQVELVQKRVGITRGPFGSVDDDTKVTEEEFRKLYLGEWIADEDDKADLSKLRKAIEEVHKERDKRGPFCFTFGCNEEEGK